MEVGKEVSLFGSKKIAVVSAGAGVVLTGAALLAGAGLVGAQEPTPTPQQEQQQTPDQRQTPQDGTTTPKSREECNGDKQSGSSGGGTTSSGTAPDSGVRGARSGNPRF